MKKLYLSFLLIPSFLLTGCLGANRIISKDEFIEKANKTKEDTYKYASIQVKANLESSSKENPNANRKEKIDRVFKYCYIGGFWAFDTSESYVGYSDTEKQFLNQFTVYLSNSIRDIIKEKPINRESTAGLTFYDNKLAYRYLVGYEDYKSTMSDGSGGTINVVTNGDMAEKTTFNSKNGRIVAYQENDDLTNTYSYDEVTMSIRDIVNIDLKITYSNKK